MDAGSFRFGVGEFECVSVSDGALNYPPESLFSNVPLKRVEEALRHLDLPTAYVMTSYTCLYIDTSGCPLVRAVVAAAATSLTISATASASSNPCGPVNDRHVSKPSACPIAARTRLPASPSRG